MQNFRQAIDCDLQFPSLSPKCLAARFIASVTLAFIACATAVPIDLSTESPAPQSSLYAPDFRWVKRTLEV